MPLGRLYSPTGKQTVLKLDVAYIAVPNPVVPSKSVAPEIIADVNESSGISVV